ncbi:MAG: methyltransferase domain-containing protein, partial [Microcystaceae cyanobacterium]
MRLIQHKQEAYWFYRFLSIFYDKYVNPFFWNPVMRTKALELAQLNRRDLKTLDVGAGTGFTTEGIVEGVQPRSVTMLDQSPHQLEKAKRKAALSECQKLLGDAEDLPFPTDHFERYVSAGSIEYWPNPQRAITEAYRVLKPGGMALIIGPLRRRNSFVRLLSDTWMLFPNEEDYLNWYRQAGFINIAKSYIAPSWYEDEGNPYGIVIAGVKPAVGPSPLAIEKEEELKEPMTLGRFLVFS